MSLAVVAIVTMAIFYVLYSDWALGIMSRGVPCGNSVKKTRILKGFSSNSRSKLTMKAVCM